MPECATCGNQVPEGSRFCPSCGSGAVANREGGPPVPSQPPQSDYNIATLLHLSAFAGFLVPFGNLIGPLVIWLLKRHDSAFVDQHGKAAVNFQISMTIYFVISVILIFLLIGIPLLIGLVVFDLIATILAAVRANDGREYNYPLTIRFIK